MGAEWYRKTAHELRDAIAGGEVSAREVTDSCLARIEAVDSRVLAFVEVWLEEARRQADAIDQRLARGDDPGPLAGVPVGLKDLLCTVEGTTSCGSRILKGYRSPFDATVVARLRAAGAVLLGKVNMDEFAMGSSTENSSIQTTRNPWDLERVPGGSSGGSAACVAAAECPVALGSDTGGSIRQPAALCGVVGMKPTYGRVSRFGLVAFASSLDQIGPLTHDVEDLALTLNVICGHDPNDSTSADVPVPDFTAALGRGVEGLRVGLPREYFTDTLGDAMRTSVTAAVEVLRGQGAEPVEISLPHTEYTLPTYYIICTAEASANLARFDGVRYGYRHAGVSDLKDMYRETKSEGFGEEVQRRIMLGTYVLSSGYYDAYYLKAQKVRTLVRRDFDRAFEQCDVIATPTTPGPAFRMGERTQDPLDMYLSDIFTISAPLAGLPAVSVPCGLLDDRLPAGLQLIGRPFDEETLVRAAHVYEQARGFAMPPAPTA